MTATARRPGGKTVAGFAALALGVLLVPLDSAVNVAFPLIVADLGQAPGAIRWVVICYVLTYASLMLLCGHLGDRIGHRRVFTAGLLVSALAFFLCATATSFAWLLVFRLLQGLGGALVLSCGAALATALMSGARRGQALGFYTLLFGLGMGLGPLIAGALVEHWGWPAVFWFRLPLALAALVLVAGLPRARPPAGDGRADLAGALLLVLGLAGALLALDGATGRGFGPLATGLLSGVALAAFWIFARRARRKADAILRPIHFRDPAVALLAGGNLLLNFAVFALPLLVPFALAPLGQPLVGLALAAAPLGFVAGALAAARMMPRQDPARLAFVACLLAALGLGVTALLADSFGIAALLGAFLLIGLGQGLYQSATTSLFVARLPATERGVAGSLELVTRTFGLVACASLLSGLLPADRADGATAALSQGAGLAAGLLAVFLLLTLLRPKLWFGAASARTRD